MVTSFVFWAIEILNRNVMGFIILVLFVPENCPDTLKINKNILTYLPIPPKAYVISP